MKWLKRYAIGGLIALVVLAAGDGYKHPDADLRVGAIVIVAAIWPIVAAIFVGNVVGGVARDLHQGQVG